MALINCPECGKEISDTAQSCPHCGYPIVSKETVNISAAPKTISNISKKRLRVLAIAIICLIIVGIVCIASFLPNRQESIVGTWEDASTVEGFTFIYQFGDDGKYTSSIKKGSTIVPGGTGRYEIDGKNLNLTMSNGQFDSSEFSVKGNTMTWGSQTLTRQK